MKYNEAMFGTDIQNPDGKHSIRNVGLNLHAPLIIRNYNIDEQETAEKKEKYTPQKLLSDSLQLDSNTRVVLEYNIQQFRKFSTEHAIDYVKILEELKSDSLLSALDL
jgi:hypothetical protein